MIIVTVVIFLFLGSPRAVVIPVVAMPLSLVGAFFLMAALGFSINLLTLLALVLAIGLVVDDAIIVVENVDRHLKEGMAPFPAAIQAARELGGPIIAMTIVLVAAYVPIGFQGGLTGALFTQFAFTLAGAVTISGIIALTLSPMMCSKIFRTGAGRRPLRALSRSAYSAVCGTGISVASRTGCRPGRCWWCSACCCCAVLYISSSRRQSELAPQEEQGVVLSQVIGPPNTTIDQMMVYSDQVYQAASKLPEYDAMFQITGAPSISQGFGGVLLKPWGERKRSADELQKYLQDQWNHIAGARVAAFQFPSLPGSQGLPLQFVITTTEPVENLNEVATQVLDKAKASGMFLFIDSDLKLDKPQATLAIDRAMVADMCLTQQDVGSSLGAALGGGYVNYFSIAGRSYKVIPQVLQRDRLNPDQVLDYYVRAGDGSLIPARTVATSYDEHRAGIDQPLPAAQLGHDRGRSRCFAGRGAEIPAQRSARGGSYRLHGRFLGAVAAVHTRLRQLRGDAVLRAHHRVPGRSRRSSRKLPRSGGHSRIGADGVVRGAALHQRRARYLAQHLHAGRDW